MRSIYIDAENRANFISEAIFIHALNNHEIFYKIQENAMALSKVYALNKNGLHASLVDLFLAGRVMLDPLLSTKIITANIRDFPSCVFDIDGMISKIKKDGSVQNYCVLSFNKKKFDLEVHQLESFV